MTQYLVSINADEPELKEIKIENDIVEGDSDLRKLCCSCCLSESFTLLPTSNCSHYDHYKQYFDIKNLHNGEYVCVICHEMLKKIENFNNMVLDSYHILANNITVHNTRRKTFVNLQISTRPIINIKTQNSDQTIQFSDQELTEDINDSFDRKDSIPLNKACLNIQQNNESSMIMPYCKEDPSSSNNSSLTLILSSNTSESTIKRLVFIHDPVHSESNTQERTFCWAPRINDKFEGKIKFVKLSKEDYSKERAEKMKTNERYQNCEFKCNDCIFGYKTKKLLDKHILDKHTYTKKDNSFKKEQCAYCKLFVIPPLSVHEEKHFGRFECCVCQYRCRNMKAAAKHYNENHDERTRKYKTIDKAKKRLFMEETVNTEDNNKILTENCAENITVCSNDKNYAINNVQKGEQKLTKKRPLSLVENCIVYPGSSKLELESIVFTGSTVHPTTAAADVTEQNLSRKRKRCPENWQRVVRKNKREAGEEYVNIKGKHFPAKQVHGGCDEKCVYNCSASFSEKEREELKKAFYLLKDSQKNKYYSEFTCRVRTQRKRTKAEESRRKFSFQYFFLKNDHKVRVCQKFFCGTLDISEKRIYYFHKKLHNNPLKLIPTPSKGKYVKRQTPENKIEEVMQHIKSFPTQESQFCKANTKCQYLDQSLSIAKMYSIYVETIKEPVKENVYRKVFNNKFNLSFHRPKKDACHACSEHKVPNAKKS